VFFDVCLRGFHGVVIRVVIMPVSEMGLMARLLRIPAAVELGCFAVVPSGMLVVFCSLLVVFRS
jgi:hypothetical protein